NDGETLVYTADSQPTVFIDPKTISQTSSNQKQGVSPVFAYLLVGLISLMIGGGIVALFLFNPFSKPIAEQNSTQKNAETASKSNSQAENQPIQTAPQQPTPTPKIVVVPAPVAETKSLGLKSYSGNVGGTPATFNLVWNKNKSISGSFYYNSSPNVIYTVSGSNYSEGSSDLRVSQGSNVVGQMSLGKTLEGNQLCWQGNFSSGNQYVRFCRYR
ncbi:MAG TPA: hypothetical protein PKY59_17300, partial [Pyrinomonadaceae bacterium]|nr:hypothetical protein [Pyrinomonadaceae bacterium]